MELDIVTINSGDTDRAIRVLEEAIPFFPKGIWDGYRYRGGVQKPHDGKLIYGEEIHPFLYYETVVEILRRLKLRNNIFGVTEMAVCDVKASYEKDRGNFVYKSRLIHDIAVPGKGVVAISLFNLYGVTPTMVAAHALGHDRGLAHHTDQIDCMNVSLLQVYTEIRYPFCKDCDRKLKKNV